MRFRLLFFILNILLVAEARADVRSNAEIPSFDWHVVQFPNSEGAAYGMFLKDSTAWLTTSGERLLHFQHGRWQIDPSFAFEMPTKIFGAEKIYVICKNKLTGRWHIQALEKGRWETIETPNSEMIRRVHFVAPNNIWAACEWGELLHFDGQKWNLLSGPSFMHNNDIYYQNDSSIWVASECYNKRTVSHWDGDHWTNYEKAKTGKRIIPFTEIERILPLNNETYIGLISGEKDSILTIEKGEVEIVDWDKMVADTLEKFIPLYQDSIPLFVKKNAYTELNFGIYTSEKEFLVVNKSILGYSAYWKAANNKVYYVRFLPAQLLKRRNSIFKSYKITKIRYGYGCAFIDVDNDGREELFIIDTEDKNKLYRVDTDFFKKIQANELPTDIAGKFNIDGQKIGKNGWFLFDHSVSFGDIGNDGDEDAYVTSLYSNNLFYENRNGKFFKEKGEQAGIDIGITRSIMGIWCDVNNDGKLDLFVTNEDTTNMVFLNRGGGNFANVTEKSGLETEQRGNGACFGDLDLDGDQDLVVVFQNIRDRIYRNDTPKGSAEIRFTDVTEKWWPAQKDTNTKSISCMLADYDNDGDLDLFVTHKIFSNRLFQNDGKGHFRDVTIEAGLKDSSISNSAGFFDADNDGDLDLYVANRGKDVFYENLGNKRFKINLSYFGGPEPLNSTDFLCGDPDNDGDLDCVLPRGVVKESEFFRNELDNGNFIKINLIGVKSNRSAIGAKAFLYEAGHVDEIAFCKGLREISSSSGYGSMNSHAIHYGVDPAKRYDLRVIFPSGITMVKKDIPAGSFLQIAEQEGFIVFVERAKQFILFTIKNRERQLELAKLLFFFLIALFSAKFFIRKRKLAAKNLKYVFASGFVPYVLLKIGNANLANPYSDWFLFFISILAIAITMLILTRKKMLLSCDLIIEELNLACRNFDHGNWGASHLNQIQLFSSNLRKNEKISQKICDEIEESIVDFYGSVYKEISKIAQLAGRAKVEIDKAYQLENFLISLSETLNKIKVELRLKQKVTNDSWEKSYLYIENIKKDIKSIGAKTREYFQSDLFRILQKTISQFKRNYECIVRQNIPFTDKKIVLMREPDLMPIFENLLANGYQAMSEKTEKCFSIEYCQENKSAIVRVTDSGAGIPKKFWETIFQQNYTTKQQGNGGFGLYFARTRLEKYGGFIKVEKSSAKKGTTILVSIPLA